MTLELFEHSRITQGGTRMVECADRVYIVSYNPRTSELTVGFNGGRGAMVEALRDATESIKELDLPGGGVIKITGSIQTPIALLLGHELGHKYNVMAVYDPPTGKYIVSVSHDPENYPLGMLL